MVKINAWIFGITIFVVLLNMNIVQADGPFPIGFGETKTGTISSTSQMDTYTFFANSGDQILMRMFSQWGHYPIIKLYYPNGSLFVSTTGGPLGPYTNSPGFAQNSTKLPLSGTYSILVGDDNGVETGNYTVYIQRTNNPGNSKSINFGDIKYGIINLTNHMDTYTFSANSGDQILTRINSVFYNPDIRLYYPNGTLYVDTIGSTSGFAENQSIMPVDGIYKVLVGDGYLWNNYYILNGNYSFFVQRLNIVGSDTKPPVTSITLTKIGSTYLASLIATDYESGVNNTLYNFGGNNWNTYTEPFTININTPFLIQFRSIDNAGNFEPVSSIKIG